MKFLLKLIRPLNLLIIALTQVMIRYFIIIPLLGYREVYPVMTLFDFILLVITTMIIAAAGYMINDYFDVDADRVNKPHKVIIGKKIRFEHAKIIYYLLNGIAIGIGLYLAYRLQSFQLGLIFPIIIIMLYYYSARYKNMVFWGNLVVGILSGFTVFIVWLFEFFALRTEPGNFLEAQAVFHKINIMVWGFSAFAFLTSLLREMIKDMQDIEGDRRIGSKTMPVVIGNRKSSFVAAGVTFITMFCLAYAQYYLYRHGFHYAVWYLLIAVQFLLIYLLLKLFSSSKSEDYKFLSGLSKIIMLAGILSMQLIYLDL